MDSEIKKRIFFGSILGIVLLLSVIYLTFGSYINKGTLAINAETPFIVEIYGGEQFTCATTPCEITHKSGTIDIILAKEGKKSIVETVKIPLWKTANLNITFEMVPYITQSENLPELKPAPTYEILPEGTNFKLVNQNDEQQRAIVFFPKQIKNPKIFGSEKTALIIDQGAIPPTAYKVDLILKDKERVEDFDFSNIENGQWSPDGNNFSFRDNGLIKVLNTENKIHQLSLDLNRTNIAWTYQNSLLFVTDQDLQVTDETGKYTNYITPLSTKSLDSFSFGEYHPEEDSYTQIHNFSEIIERPSILIPANNGRTIYFQVGGVNFKLLL